MKEDSVLNRAENIHGKMQSADENGGEEVLHFHILNKNINTPIGMKDILIQGDKKSRKIFFEINRYLDGVDLSNKDIFIHFVNAKNQSGTDSITEKYVTDATITFEWWVPGQLSVLNGTVAIQVEISEFDTTGDTVYRYLTKPVELVIERTISPSGTVDQQDYYLDIQFLNKYTEDITYNMASSLAPIQIQNREIIMPYLEDFIVTQDTRSKIVTFIIDRYFDQVDLAEKTIVIKFELPDGKGDRAFTCNREVSDTKIRFDWVIDSRATSQEGMVIFSIEFIGENEKGEFYCWNTLPNSFLVSKGLNIDDTIEQPAASWIQSWNVLADKYLRNYLKYISMLEEGVKIVQAVGDDVKKAVSQAKAYANSSKVNADIAWEQADRADQIKTQVIILKADFDTKKSDFDGKYQNFINTLPELRRKDEKIEYDDLHTTLASYIDNKSDKTHTHKVDEIENARSTNVPITENDLSLELVEKLNSIGSPGSGDNSGGSGSGGLSLADIFNDMITSNSKGWTSNKIYSFVKDITDLLVKKDKDKILSDNNFSDYYRKKLDSIEENANYFDAAALQNIPLALLKQDSLHRTLTEAEIKLLKDKYTRAEVDNLIAGVSNGFSWKDPVNTHADLAAAYPNPKSGYTVNVENDPDQTKSGTYTYNEETKSWVKISSSSTPLATIHRDGLMSKQDKTFLNTVKEFLDNYEEPEVTPETIEALKREINSLLKGYLPSNVILGEENIDPALIERLSASDGSLIDDSALNVWRVWSSSRTAGAIEDAVSSALSNAVSETEVSNWFTEVDKSFSWSNWL